MSPGVPVIIKIIRFQKEQSHASLYYSFKNLVSVKFERKNKTNDGDEKPKNSKNR